MTCLAALTAEIDRLRAELNAIADLAYRGGDRDALVDLLHTIHTRARAAGQPGHDRFAEGWRPQPLEEPC